MILQLTGVHGTGQSAFCDGVVTGGQVQVDLLAMLQLECHSILCYGQRFFFRGGIVGSIELCGDAACQIDFVAVIAETDGKREYIVFRCLIDGGVVIGCYNCLLDDQIGVIHRIGVLAVQNRGGVCCNRCRIHIVVSCLGCHITKGTVVTFHRDFLYKVIANRQSGNQDVLVVLQLECELSVNGTQRCCTA